MQRDTGLTPAEGYIFGIDYDNICIADDFIKTFLPGGIPDGEVDPGVPDLGAHAGTKDRAFTTHASST